LHREKDSQRRSNRKKSRRDRRASSSKRRRFNIYSDDRQEILNQLSEGVRIELGENHWQIISYCPLQFVIAHKDLKRIVHAYVDSAKTELNDTSGDIITKEYERLNIQRVTLEAIPITVIRESSPLGFAFASQGYKYTITFDTNGYNKRPFTIKSKTIDEIFSELKQMSLVSESRGAQDDLSKIIMSFDKTNSTIISEDLQTPGFYYMDGKLKAYHITKDGKESNVLPKQPTTSEIRNCIDVIEKLVINYKRKEIIPTVLKWGIAAPFDFALKQYTDDMVFLPWLYPYGWTRTGKTTLGLIVLVIWRQAHDSTHKMSFSKLDTEARFGNVISKTTFPKVANEVGTLGDERHRGLLEMFKNAIETRIARGKYFQKVNYADIPSLSPCVLTGNPKPPNDSGFQSRIIPIVFTKGDKHSEEERQKFVSFFIKEVGP
jgi:hypothetical protein